MLSSRALPTAVEAIKFDMLWDGLFHAFTWAVSFAGVFLLWQTAPSVPFGCPDGCCGGAVLAGWGLFNFVEGLIGHQIQTSATSAQASSHVTWASSRRASSSWRSASRSCDRGRALNQSAAHA